jgi:hypothetical protein
MENELNTYQKEDRLFYNHFTGELITNFMFVKISSVDNAKLKDATCSIIKDKDIEYTYLNPLNIDVILSELNFDSIDPKYISQIYNNSSAIGIFFYGINSFL